MKHKEIEWRSIYWTISSRKKTYAHSQVQWLCDNFPKLDRAIGGCKTELDVAGGDLLSPPPLWIELLGLELGFWSFGEVKGWRWGRKKEGDILDLETWKWINQSIVGTWNKNGDRGIKIRDRPAKWDGNWRSIERVGWRLEIEQ